MKDLYIPLGSDAGDVMVYATAAYRDRPPVGQRMRTEMWASINSPDETAGLSDEDASFLNDDEARSEVEEMLIQSSDVAWDATKEIIEMTAQAGPGVVSMRLLLKDELYYQRIEMREDESAGHDLGDLELDDAIDAEASDKPKARPTAKPAGPARWNQLIDLAAVGMAPEQIDEFRHPERALDQILDVLMNPKLKFELRPDESLPHGEIGCRMLWIINDFEAFLALTPKSQREGLATIDGQVRFPITISVLISRDTGYLHQVESEVDAAGVHLKIRVLYYNHDQPVHLSAPPSAEVNALLATEMVSVIEAKDQISSTAFTAQAANGVKEDYFMMDILDSNLPPLSVGDHAIVQVRHSDDDEDGKNMVVSYRPADPAAKTWIGRLPTLAQRFGASTVDFTRNSPTFSM